MRVPDHGLLRHDGQPVSLHALADERPVALVFLRPLGCLFCREQVAVLRDRMQDANVALITMAEPPRASRFRRWIRSPHPFFSDPERRLYREFRLERASPTELLGSRSFGHGVRAIGGGHRPGLPTGDVWQLGGTFIMDREGCVSATFPAHDAGDHPSPEAILGALARAA